MSKIIYLKGDATNPIGTEKKIIAHICNDVNAWGAGFVLALSKKWKEPEIEYRKGRYTLILGDVQFVKVNSDTLVANMIAQHDVMRDVDGTPPIRYDALKACLERVNESAFTIGADIHMPKIGSGLAGGDWNIISKIIEDTTTVPVYVYEL